MYNICKDKLNFNLNNTFIKLNIRKKTNYGLYNTEFQYMFADRKIFASSYLSDNII